MTRVEKGPKGGSAVVPTCVLSGTCYVLPYLRFLSHSHGFCIQSRHRRVSGRGSLIPTLLVDRVSAMTNSHVAYSTLKELGTSVIGPQGSLATSSLVCPVDDCFTRASTWKTAQEEAGALS